MSNDRRTDWFASGGETESNSDARCNSLDASGESAVTPSSLPPGVQSTGDPDADAVLADLLQKAEPSTLSTSADVIPASALAPFDPDAYLAEQIAADRTEPEADGLLPPHEVILFAFTGEWPEMPPTLPESSEAIFLRDWRPPPDVSAN